MAGDDMRNATRLIGLAALVAATVSCGDVVRQGSSPVFLVIDSLTPTTLNSDVVTNGTASGDIGTVGLRLTLKDIGATSALSPTTNNEVTINRIHVEYTRADGHNTQGVDVPYAFDGAATATIAASGTVSLVFEVVRKVAKQESPLANLRTSPNVITTITKVTFYGTDRTGNAISVTGQMQINFGDF